MGQKLKRILCYTAMLCLAIGLLWVSFSGIKWEDFLAGFKSCSWGWIIASMLFGVMGFCLRALRWRLLLRQLDPSASFRRAYEGLTIGNLANFALPRIGEIVRSGVATSRKKGKLTFEGAIGTVVVERAWDLICLMAIALAFVFLAWNTFGYFIKNQIFSSSPASASDGGGWGYFILFALIAIVLLAIVLFIFRKNLIGRKLKTFGSRLWAGATAAFKMKAKYKFLILTILLWSSFVVTSKCTLMAFPTLSSLGWIDALFLMIVGSLGWAVPVQGGLGAYHFIVSLAMVQMYAVTKPEAMVFATISHESQAVAMILCGAASLVSFTFMKKREKPCL